MNPLPPWPYDWDALDFPWLRAMQGCPQDPAHHAEGDVWTHARMVCAALTRHGAWRALSPADQRLVYTAAVLHDVAKPQTTRLEEGRITSRGHSQRGAIMARRILWEQGAAFAEREAVCAIVRHHQTPFHLIHRDDAAKTAHRLSQLLRCDLLALHARADALGRHCQDQAAILEFIDLFEELCREQPCLRSPFVFPSPLSRFEYFRRESRHPHYEAHDESRCEVILMCGLPGSGKDHWLQQNAAHLPTISLDDLRAESDADEGTVLQTAREQARTHLRAGRPFAWNATNLTRDRRAALIELFTAYQARVRIVYVEAPWPTLFTRNESRPRVVPPKALERMMERWDPPDVTEAPQVDYFIG